MELKFYKNNKTSRFLAPGLIEYGDELQKYLDKVKIIGFASYSSKNLFPNKQPFYIIIDKQNSNKSQLIEFITYIRNSFYYLDDYPLYISEDSKYSSEHIVVIQYPKELENTYKYFKSGKYSMMYRERGVSRYLEEDCHAYQIIKKTKRGLELFKKELEDYFNIDDLKSENMEDYDEYCLSPNITIKYEQV